MWCVCAVTAQADYPVLWKRLKTAVASGRFQPVGGTWVEVVVSCNSACKHGCGCGYGCGFTCYHK